MLTVALWDLGQGKRPPLSMIPKVLRRVGVDLVAIAGPPAGSIDSIGRHSGYRERVRVDTGQGEVGVLSRRGLVERAATLQPGVAELIIKVAHGPLHLIVASLEEPNSAATAKAIVDSQEHPFVIAGKLGHNLASPQGAWALLRRDLIDHIEHAGASTARHRSHGFLSHGVQPRGGGTLSSAGGGSNDLIWVRVAV